MKPFMNMTLHKGGYLLGLAAAALVGGLTSAMVLAAIPSSDGAVHGCYGKVAGNLRVIDVEAGKHCTAAENPINWNAANGGGNAQTAYAKFAAGGVPYNQATLDPTYTTGVIDSKPANTYGFWCFDLTFVPKLGLMSTYGTAGGTVLSRGISPTQADGIDQECGPGFDAIATPGGTETDANTVFTFYN